MTITNRTNKRNKILIIVLLILLIGTNVYHFTNKNEIVDNYNSKINDLNIEKSEIQAEFITSSNQVDSLNQTNKNLTEKLSNNNDEISKLKSQISKLLKKESLTIEELTTAKSLVAQLNAQVKDFSDQISKLQEENQQLTTKNQELASNLSAVSEEKQKVQESLDKSEREKAAIEDIASTMLASFFKLTVVKETKNGKQKITSSAKKANLFKVEFVLADNKLASSGTKDIYIIITSPDGTVLSESPENKFTTREEGERTYSDKISITFTQGQATPVNYDRKINKASKGLYKIEVYQNGFKIGEDFKELK